MSPSTMGKAARVTLGGMIGTKSLRLANTVRDAYEIPEEETGLDAGLALGEGSDIPTAHPRDRYSDSRTA